MRRGTTSREKCRGKIKFTAREIGAICSGVEERKERTDEDESGGWFRSVSGCVGWFAAREMEGLGHARERRGEGDKVSRGDGAGVPRVIDCLLRKDEASSLPAAEVISFEKARAFSPGSGFEEERRNERSAMER